ncbi:MAG: hypothetical protein WD848_04305 [Dehalococcoidia bacterium]
MFKELAETVDSYLSGSITLDDLREEYVSRLGLPWPEDEAEGSLFGAIVSGFAMLSDGVLSVDGFRDQLRSGLSEARKLAA